MNKTTLMRWSAAVCLLAGTQLPGQSVEVKYMPAEGAKFDITERTTRATAHGEAEPVTDTRVRMSRLQVMPTAEGYENTVTIASQVLERNGNAVVSPIYAAMEGLALTYNLDSSGALVEITGYEQLKDALAAKLPDKLAGTLAQLLNFDSLRQQDTASYNEVYGDFTGGMIEIAPALAIASHPLPMEGHAPVYSLTTVAEVEGGNIAVMRTFNSDGMALAAESEEVTEEALAALDTTLMASLPEKYATVAIRGTEQTLVEPGGALVVARQRSFEYVFTEKMDPPAAEAPAEVPEEAPAPATFAVSVMNEFLAVPVVEEMPPDQAQP